MNPLVYIKAYATAFIASIVLLVMVSMSATAYVYKVQRDKARSALVSAQSVLDAYKRESDAAIKRAAEIMKLAESNEVANAKTIADLKAQVATSDAEAKRLAIEAGKVIGGLK